MNGLFLKMRTRVRTLVIPYLIGCSFFPILFFALSLIPFAATNINSDVHEMFHKSICKLLWDIFISADNGSPMAFQLWFLRDLIIYVALSPLIWFAVETRIRPCQPPLSLSKLRFRAPWLDVVCARRLTCWNRDRLASTPEKCGHFRSTLFSPKHV